MNQLLSFLGSRFSALSHGLHDKGIRYVVDCKVSLCECQGTKDGFEDGYRSPDAVICSQGDLGSNLPLPLAVLMSLGKSRLFHSS